MLSIEPWDWIKARRRKWLCYDIWNIGVVNKDIDEICRNGRLDHVVGCPDKEVRVHRDLFVLKNASELTVLVEESETCEAARARSFDAGSHQELGNTSWMRFWISNAIYPTLNVLRR